MHNQWEIVLNLIKASDYSRMESAQAQLRKVNLKILEYYQEQKIREIEREANNQMAMAV